MSSLDAAVSLHKLQITVKHFKLRLIYWKFRQVFVASSWIIFVNFHCISFSIFLWDSLGCPQQWEASSSCSVGQQMWPAASWFVPQAAQTGELLQRVRICRLVWNLCQGKMRLFSVSVFLSAFNTPFNKTLYDYHHIYSYYSHYHSDDYDQVFFKKKGKKCFLISQFFRFPYSSLDKSDVTFSVCVCFTCHDQRMSPSVT